MDPWSIPAWVTELDKVDRILVENVTEFVKWGPVAVSTGRPIRTKEGLYHDEWVNTLDRLGFDYSYKFLNCADYGDATTRYRYFGQFRRRGLGKGTIRWPHPTHAKEPAHDLLAPRQRWRPARDCIDWSQRGNSIYGRKRDLSAKTLLRIHAGIVKFGWPERYVIRLRRHMEARGIKVPDLLAMHARLAKPIDAFVLSQHASGTARSVDEPTPGIVTVNRTQLVQAAEPFVLAQGEGSEGRPVSQPSPTIPCGGAHALVAPYYGSGSGLTAKSVDDPLDTIPTVDRFGLIVPVTNMNGGNVARSAEQPFPTIVPSKGGHLAFITSAFGERDGQMPRIRAIESPAPTIAAQGYVPLVDASDDDDILYRMLQPPELARATSFPDDYQFAGNKTEVTRQIGNAVPIKMARALVRAALWDLAA